MCPPPTSVGSISARKRSRVHFVVQTDSQMVDLTRQQFFPLCDNPFLQTLNLFAGERTTIVTDDFNSRMRPRLS